MNGHHPFKVTVTVGGRDFTMEGWTPHLEGGSLKHDRLFFATLANCLLSCSKSMAEAGVWTVWQQEARKTDMRRLPKEKM